MEFSPNDEVVKLCLQGMGMEEKGKPEEASKLFVEAWDRATGDLGRFIAAYHVARHQKDIPDQLKWLETTLELGLKINDEAVRSAFMLLYSRIAKCHEDLKDHEMATRNYALAAQCGDKPSDKGPFYHGTKADLEVGTFLVPGGASNYKADLKMNHVYFTALAHGAGLAAALAKGEGRERVYIVEPTGLFEDDPNVTNKRFPGNLTRSYRSVAPLRIVGELSNWSKQTPEELQRWREKVARNKGEIIN